MIFWILKSKRFTFKARGCRICGIKDFFFSNFLKIKRKRLKWPSVWFYDSTLGSGATPYGVRVLRAPYMIKISELEHLTASKQPEVLEELLDVSEGRPRSNQEDVLTTWSTRRRPPSTRHLQDSATKSSGACQTRGSGTTHRHRMF